MSDDFLELVKQLRELGAVRVRDGAREVAFAGPAEAPSVHKPVDMQRVSLEGSEVGELESLRAMRRRLEELGMDV